MTNEPSKSSFVIDGARPPQKAKFGIFSMLFTLLLLLSITGVMASVTLRNSIEIDFRQIKEAEREDSVYSTLSELESSLKETGWDRSRLSRILARGLFTGLFIELYDYRGSKIIDSRAAVDLISESRQRDIQSMLKGKAVDSSTPADSYPLFINGFETGRIEVRFMKDERASLFHERSNRFLMFSAAGFTLVSLILATFAAQKSSLPLKKLSKASQQIAQRKSTDHIPVKGAKEIADTSKAFNLMLDSLSDQEVLRKKLFAKLRTPLTAMRCELEGMLEGILPMELERITSLIEEVDRITRLISGMEELAQAESSRIALKRCEIKLASFLMDISEKFKPLALSKGVELIVMADEDAIIEADPDRLSQIIINLASNAIRATDSGAVSLIAKKETAEIIVKDSGKGISPDEIPHLFERFYHGNDGGMGIGLAIVSELVNAHGWRISVKSEVGIGSEFIISS